MRTKSDEFKYYENIIQLVLKKIIKKEDSGKKCFEI